MHQGPTRPFRIVIFGASTTAPLGSVRIFGDILRDELPRRGLPVEVINRGVSGNTSRAGLERLERDVLAERPDLVIVQFGLNDSTWDVWKQSTGPRVPQEEFEGNLRAILHACRGIGAAVIVLTLQPFHWTAQWLAQFGKPPYHPEDYWGFCTTLEPYNDAIRRIVAREGMRLVDVNRAFRAEAQRHGGRLEHLYLDGMHPNDAGHRLMADLMIPQVLAAAGRD